MTAQRLRIGLVGAGMVSRHHLLGWQAQARRAQVVAIADPSRESRVARVEAFGIERNFPDLRTMLDTVPLDAVDICAPRETHVELVKLAAERGLPVLCQKPLAPALAEAEALVRAVDGRVKLMVHENWRFRPYYRQARRWIEEGRIGTVRQARMDLLSSGMIADAGGARPALVRQPFFAGLDRLLVMEILIHHIDTLRYLLGPLTLAASAIGRSTAELRGEDSAVLMLRSADGTAILTGNLAAYGHGPVLTDRAEFLGDAGAITLRDGVLALVGAQPETITYDLAEAYQTAYDDAIGHFLDGLETGAPFETGPADNLETLRLVEAVYAASRP